MRQLPGLRAALSWLGPLAGIAMTYSVKEAFYTLQGEGAQTGRAAVFLRFAGCNLWSGLERDRPKAVCQFCDTDFVGTDGENGGKYKTAQEVAALVASIWNANADTAGKPYVVCTGGEPLLQLDPPLIAALHDEGFVRCGRPGAELADALAPRRDAARRRIGAEVGAW